MMWMKAVGCRGLAGAAVLVLALSGCGSDSETGAEGSTVEGAMDAGTVDMQPELQCPGEGELVCDGRCTDVTFNMEHCGSCGNACLIGTSSCIEGECRCLNGRTRCDGFCVDLEEDREHCGACGTSCELSEACVSGSCVLISDRAEVVGVLDFTNQRRDQRTDCGEYGWKNPVGPVQQNDLLNAAAQGHAEDMADNQFMDHTGSDGSSPFERAERAGYSGSFVGENVARGYRTPEAVVQGWTDSDGHCSNMMNGGYTEIGIGYAVSSGGEPFWVQLFGDR